MVGDYAIRPVCIWCIWKDGAGGSVKNGWAGPTCGWDMSEKLFRYQDRGSGA